MEREMAEKCNLGETGKDDDIDRESECESARQWNNEREGGTNGRRETKKTDRGRERRWS